jgi:hypothetical protein
MQVDIVTTKQGCLPYVKTFEVNQNNQRKYVKALKLYNSRTDQRLANQIIVDEGIVH